jgi:radical SAM superfamily enzyme YgiQ (UPF0313 family)
MKILFVSPDISYKNENRTILSKLSNKFLFGFGKSLTFPILAALTPETHEVEYVEMGYNQINNLGKYDLVAVTVFTKNALLSYEIADEFRRHSVKVVLGGYHVSALPDEAKQHADAVVVGEAEYIWPKLINDLENNQLKSFYISKKPVNPKDISSPKLGILPKGANTTVQATRGCPYNCEFCAIVNMKHRKKFRMRPIQRVIEDIKSLPNKGFFFIDSSLTVNREYTKELFRQMKPLNKKFYAYGNVDILGKDDELLKLSSDAGCLTWYIGFESISQNTVNSIGKTTNLVNDYISSIKKIHDHGMIIMGSFIFGFDHDNKDVFYKTDEFIRKSEVDIPLLRVLTPFPGTPLFTRLDSEGRIISRDWSKYDLDHVVFQPKNMTPIELDDCIKKLRKKQYNLPNSIIRTIRSAKFGIDIFLETAFMSMFLNSKS